MARRTITYNNYSLQDDNIHITGMETFEQSNRQINMQGFAQFDGAKITSTQFNPKVINITGYIKGSSASELDDRIDDLKKNLQNTIDKDLIITYSSGTRRFIASCQDIAFNRQNWTIDYIEFSARFVISNPPFGKELNSSTLTSNVSNSFVSTTTGEHTGTISHNGTIPPYPIVKFSFVSANGVNKIEFTNTNNENFTTTTRIDKKMNDGDFLEIDVELGRVRYNGSEINYSGGMPRFSLEGNSYTIKIVGDSYNCDVKFAYYPLWA